ncbi:DNA-binding protein YbiB [Undibacterium sp. Ji22W]|uniref:DNA-binding protein YbiB n=1 Tax=Undibacterium sp. Ji22W TaxID=3413038 RepID=UPI003BF3B6E1
MKNTQDKLSAEVFQAAAYIKEIGRGKEGARNLSRADAYQLYTAMLDGRVSDLEMGAILIAMRIKGETIEEIAGFLEAAENRLHNLQTPNTSQFAPIVIPSYNGARKRPNLTPLLALLLAREGVPVLVHGLEHDVGRVTSAAIFSAIGIEPSFDVAHAEHQLNRMRLAFMPLQALSPKMHRILMMRKVLGLRNSTHTLVKILQPFEQAAVRLTSYTHPEYQLMLDNYFRQLAPHHRGIALMMRGTEGETVASTGRSQRIDKYYMGECETLEETNSQLLSEPESLPPDITADATATWIQNVLAGKHAIPVNIERQVWHCVQLAKELKINSA